MATNNNGHLLDDSGNVAVDFVWGNFPMQPNDDRTNLLDFSLNSHAIAETGWNGYPLYTPNTEGGYTSGVAYAVVPNLVGLTEALATDALVDAGLAIGTVSTTGTGATEENDGTVKTQQYSAGAEKALGITVNVTLYAYSA